MGYILELISRRQDVRYEFVAKNDSYLVKWQDVSNGEVKHLVTVYKFDEVAPGVHDWNQQAEPLEIKKLKPSVPRSRNLLIHFL